MLSALDEFLRSVRLTLALFLLLAGGAILGTLIPQNLSLQEYGRLYGTFASRFFVVLGITDVYHSVWFLLMIVTLVLNLIACSVHRFPSAWKALRQDQRPLTDRLWEAVHVRQTLRSDKDPEEVAGVIHHVFARGRWRVRRMAQGKEIHLMARKGRYGRMGVFITHLGVVVTLLGAMVGIFWGFKGFIQVPEGRSVAQIRDNRRGSWRDLGFQVRCDAFRMTTYADGTPKEYRSDLSFVRDGDVVGDGVLRVNHPLRHGGYTFYQSSYGYTAKVTLEVGANPNGPTRKIRLDVGETANLNLDRKLMVRPMKYDPNFRGQGPAVLLTVQRQGGSQRTGWLQQGDPPVPVDGWDLRFVDKEARAWTGLQVKKDPGVSVVWIGCALILMGCWMAFFVPERRIWVRLRREGRGTLCHVGASSPRARPGLEHTVERLCHSWHRQAGLGFQEERRGDE